MLHDNPTGRSACLRELVPPQVPISPWLTACGLDWSELTRDFPPETVPKGTVLYWQGGPADELFLILSGRAQLECCHSDGKKRTIYVISSGVTVGEAGCLFHGTRDYQAITITECQICRVPAPEFRRRVEQSTALAMNVLYIAARKGQILAHLLVSDGFLDLRARLLQTLLYLAEQYGTETPEGVLLSIRFTHQDIADLLGTSRVAISQSFQELARKGFIQKQGRFYLLAPRQELEAYLNQSPSL